MASNNKHTISRRKPLLLGLLVFAAVFATTQVISYQKYLLVKSNQRTNVDQHTLQIKEQFQNVFDQSFASTQMLAYIVENYGIPNNFDSICKPIFDCYSQIDALELLDKNGTITHVYPLEGNNIKGYNIFENPQSRTGANATVNGRQYFVSGPFNLKQGGIGFVSRMPLYQESELIGFTAAVLKLPTLLKAMPFDTIGNGNYAYRISKLEPNSSEMVFYSSSNDISMKNASFVPITTERGEWKLYVISTKNISPNLLISLSLFGLLLAILSSILTWYVIKQPLRLKVLVDEKTRMLNESESKYRNIIEQASDGIFIYNKKGRILDLNQSGANMFGYVKNEMVGKDISEFIDDEDLAVQPLDFNALSSTQNLLRERKMIHKSNERFYVEINARMLSNHEVIAIVRNVTDRKELELAVQSNLEKFTKSFNNSNVGMCIFNQHREIIDVNDCFLKLFNWEREEVLGKTPLQLGFYEPYKVGKENMFFDIISAHGKVENIDLSLKTRSGAKKHVLFSAEAIDLKESFIILSSFVDQTESKQAKKTLRKQNMELKKTNSELDRFVYSASHELRAPLTSVMGLIEVISLDYKDPNLIDSLKMMETSVKRLDDFIKDIVEYSRNRHLEMANEKINFKTMINHSLESMWYLEKRSKIKILTSIDDVERFESDKRRIIIILNNFISNAIKYHDVDQEDPTVWIRVKTSKNDAVIEVADNGPGIAEEHLGKIFNMFYRVSSKIMGSGIGLFIVKEIIVKLDGKLEVRSTLGKGSTFTIRIPNKTRKKHESKKDYANR